MANNISHFDIPCDDVERAKRFYGEVFGWKFEAWGPPDFYLIETGTPDDPGIHGALTKRREKVTHPGIHGFECTITVADLDATIAAVEKHGGKITLDKMTIPTVGTLIQFVDTEGNTVSAMKYERAELESPFRKKS
jgi:predicted enzyme related to lactoylglutathione lyase